MKLLVDADFIVYKACAGAEDENVIGTETLKNAGAVYVFSKSGGMWSEVQKIVAADRGAGAYFGKSICVSGDYLIVGAPYENEDEMGLDSLGAAGSAYIYKNNGGTWTEVQKIVASDRGSTEFFGWSVAISGDYAIVGAYLDSHDEKGGDSLKWAGSAYIFRNNGGVWTEVRKIVASDREASSGFGYSVAISGDYAISGATGEDENAAGLDSLMGAGAAYFYKNEATNGIVENSFGDGLVVYPNPTNGNFSIDLGAVYENTQVFITDISGKLIESKTIAQSQVLNLSINEPAGIYLVTIQSGELEAVIQIVKE